MLSLMLLSCILVVHQEDDTGRLLTCEQVADHFATELTRVQSCQAAAECGQPLAGTSCGCTRNLVARIDADTTRLYALMELAAERSCDLGLASPCDCPQTYGFACDDGRCAWRYDPPPALPDCQAAEGDPYTIDDASISGDHLLVTTSASGGCAEHAWTLCWPDGSFMESWPVQARLEILHDDNDDPCDAIISEDLDFDLLPLQQAWIDAYGGTTGEILIRLEGFGLAYSF